MRVTKVVLGLAGFLLISLIFVSFQAAAHPDKSDDGLTTAWGNAGRPIGNNIDNTPGVFNGFGGDSNGNALEAIGNNPLCPIHGGPGSH
jgi:hypothetical protein